MRRRRTGVVLAAVMFAAGVTALVACGNGDETATGSATAELTRTTAATSTPTVTPARPATPATTATASGCPDAQACDFARDVVAMLGNGQYDAIVERTEVREYTCPGADPQGAGGPFPLCSGAAAGARRRGYVTGALQSEGAVVSRDGLIDFFRALVAGEGLGTRVAGTGPSLATVGCPLAGTDVDCTDRFAIVITRGDGTSLLRLGVQRNGPDGAPQISQTFTGLIAVNQTMVTGGEDALPVVFGVEERIGTRYFVIE
jgi:hypothetical protein